MSQPAFPLDDGARELDPEVYLHEVLARTEDPADKQNALGSTATAEIIQLIESQPDEPPEVSWDSSELAKSADSTKQYLGEIGRVDLLDGKEAEVEVSKRIEAGLAAAHKLELEADSLSDLEREELEWLAQDGQKAKEYFVEANLRLVVSIARKYRQAKSMTMLDLVQEGNFGLIRAVEKFDYQKGYKFSTYATWWIKQAITRGLYSANRTVRYPVHTEEQIKQVNNARMGMEKQGLPHNDPEEILAFIVAERQKKQMGPPKYTAEGIKKLLELDDKTRMIELDRTAGDDGDATFGELLRDDSEIPQDDQVIYSSKIELLNTVIDSVLSERDAKILRLRHGAITGKQETLEDIAATCGITDGAIRQIIRKSLIKLREHRADFEAYLTESDEDNSRQIS